MALQTSPPISLNNIKAEFGATGTRSITEFYRGGAFVPNTPQNSKVPTSGTISLLDFLGASREVPLAGSISSIIVESIQGPSLPPPPDRVDLYGTSTATVSGGSGNYTYSWSITSGTAKVFGSSTGPTFTIYDTVVTNTYSRGNIRCVISDGKTSITRDTTYSLYYERLF